MAKPRMIQGQFGSLTYSTGVMQPGVAIPPAATVSFNENLADYMGIKRHNDKLYEFTPGNPLRS